MRETVYQEGVLLKLFYNVELQEKYLKDMLPLLFTKERKVIAFTMKHLHNIGTQITVDNMILVQETLPIKNFCTKIHQPALTRILLTEFFESTVTSRTTDLFKEAYDTLHDETFFEFVEKYKEDFTYELAYKDKWAILSRAKAMVKVYNILYGSKYKNREDGIKKAVAFLRTKKTYIPTFSNQYNSRVGGFSRGFAAAVMGKPSHGKSTLMTYNSMHLIDKDIIGKVAVLSAEEPEEIFWRRVIAAEFKIPMQMLRSGEYEVSDAQVDAVIAKYKNRINFYPVSTMTSAVDVIFTLDDTELIWIDHINALIYPKDDMNQGIGTLMAREKEYLTRRKETAIVNLTQVNTKRMLTAKRLVAQKEDTFGSSYLEQAAREIITVYYPYADATSEGLEYIYGRSKYAKWSPTRARQTIEMHVQKNSFGDKPVIELKYFEELGRFEDTDKLPQGTNVVLPEVEGKPDHTIDMFKGLE